MKPFSGAPFERMSGNSCYRPHMADLRVPAGWPSAVAPPGTQDWETTAVAWLLDILPPGYREHKRVHRYPAGMAAIARHHAEVCVEGARCGYRAIRAELGGRLPAGDVDEVLAA